MICDECGQIMPLDQMGEWAAKHICAACFLARFPRRKP